MHYVVLETQTAADGTVATLVTTHAERNEAESKFHLVLSSAAVSDLPMHAASLLQADGRLLDCRSYEHSLHEPELEEAVA